MGNGYVGLVSFIDFCRKHYVGDDTKDEKEYHENDNVKYKEVLVDAVLVEKRGVIRLARVRVVGATEGTSKAVDKLFATLPQNHGRIAHPFRLCRSISIGNVIVAQVAPIKAVYGDHGRLKSVPEKGEVGEVAQVPGNCWYPNKESAKQHDWDRTNGPEENGCTGVFHKDGSQKKAKTLWNKGHYDVQQEEVQETLNFKQLACHHVSDDAEDGRIDNLCKQSQVTCVTMCPLSIYFKTTVLTDSNWLTLLLTSHFNGKHTIL